MDETSDIDWFALDANENVLHFASGGGKLPRTVKEAKNENDFLRSFFNRLESSEEAHVCSDLGKYVTLKSDESKNAYLHDFVLMAKRGLYSFDKTYLGQPLNANYHLVCIPYRKLSLKDLPSEVQNILSKTRINFDAGKSTAVDLSSLV
jgi:hypothetical protein